MAKLAYLSLGSNIGDRHANLSQARALLVDDRLRIARASSIYETAPVDYEKQPWFLNQVLETETDYFPMQLLARMQRVERDMGRERVRDKGPRNIDIDLLLYGRFVIRSPRLEVPHPRLTQRRFVLEPLAELAPGLRHPVSKRTVRQMLEAVSGQAVRKLPGLS